MMPFTRFFFFYFFFGCVGGKLNAKLNEWLTWGDMKRRVMNHHQQKEKLLFILKLNVESITCKMCGIDGYKKENFLPFFISFQTIVFSISFQNSYMSTQNDWIMFLIIPHRTVFSCYRLNKKKAKSNFGWVNKCKQFFLS